MPPPTARVIQGQGHKAVNVVVIRKTLTHEICMLIMYTAPCTDQKLEKRLKFPNRRTINLNLIQGHKNTKNEIIVDETCFLKMDSSCLNQENSKFHLHCIIYANTHQTGKKCVCEIPYAQPQSSLIKGSRSPGQLKVHDPRNTHTNYKHCSLYISKFMGKVKFLNRQTLYFTLVTLVTG